MKNSYNLKISLKKTVRNLIIALISILGAGLMKEYPSLANYEIFGGLTIYTALMLLRDWLKHRFDVKGI